MSSPKRKVSLLEIRLFLGDTLTQANKQRSFPLKRQGRGRLYIDVSFSKEKGELESARRALLVLRCTSPFVIPDPYLAPIIILQAYNLSTILPHRRCSTCVELFKNEHKLISFLPSSSLPDCYRGMMLQVAQCWTKSYNTK